MLELDSSETTLVLSFSGHPLLHANMFQICYRGIISAVLLEATVLFWFTILTRWSSSCNLHSILPTQWLLPTSLVKEPMWGFFLLVAKHGYGEIITGSFPVDSARHMVRWTSVNIPFATWPMWCQGSSEVNINSESVAKNPKEVWVFLSPVPSKWLQVLCGMFKEDLWYKIVAELQSSFLKGYGLHLS